MEGRLELAIIMRRKERNTLYKVSNARIRAGDRPSSRSRRSILETIAMLMQYCRCYALSSTRMACT